MVCLGQFVQYYFESLCWEPLGQLQLPCPLKSLDLGWVLKPPTGFSRHVLGTVLNACDVVLCAPAI